MSEWNFELFDRRKLVIDSPQDGRVYGDFGFAFNNSNFSDRVLRICIVSEPVESTPSPSVRDKTLHISSPILAARSPFFYKHWLISCSSNGMRESEQRYVTLHINASEEAGLMELLKFMYSNNLTAISAPAVLDVLLALDKYDVASCVRYCSRLLRNLPMAPASVLVYLDLPSTILTIEAFQPLTVAAKQFYAVHYKDITKFEDEILSLPLAGVEAIIASDDLQVTSEDAVYCFVLNWARTQYPKTKDRREIIMTRLAKFIRYPYMSHIKLTKLLTCKEFDPEYAKIVVSEAISFKSQVPQTQHTYISNENSNLNHRFVERAYEYQPFKMIEFKQPRPHCVVYLDLKRDMCASLLPLEKVYSEISNLGGQRFYFMGQCYMDRFALFLVLMRKEAGAFAFDYEFAAMSKLADGFVSKFTRSYTLLGEKAFRCLILFKIPRTRFIGEDSVYFIDDVHHVRLELTGRC